MARETSYLLGSLVLCPAMIWALSGTYLMPWSGLEQATGRATIRGLLLFAVFLKISMHYAGLARFEAKARRLGCAPIPSVPLKDPLLGLDWVRDSMAALKKNSLLEFFADAFRHYGNTFTTVALGRRQLFTNDPENVKAILGKNFEDWPIGGTRLDAVVPILGKKSVFSSNGQDWHDARTMMRPSFVRNQVNDIEGFDRHVTNLMDNIPASGETFDMHKLLLAMTMDLSTDFLLGQSTNTLKKPSPQAQQFLADFEYSGNACAKLVRIAPIMLKLPHPKISEAVKRMRDYVCSYLRRIATSMPDDAARGYVFLHEVVKTGASEDHLTDQIMSVIIAGRDTTASTMTSCFWHLARNPDVVKKMRDEIEGLGEENPTWEQLKGLKYLNNVIKETLRLCPPISLNGRIAARDTVLPVGGGPDGRQPVLVPKGLAVRFSTYIMHRRTTVYGSDAEDFRPERWDEDLRVGWQYLPFSGGPRICLGQQFALTQITLTLFRIFKRYKSIESREPGPFVFHASLTFSLARCLVGMTPA